MAEHDTTSAAADVAVLTLRSTRHFTARIIWSMDLNWDQYSISYAGVSKPSSTLTMPTRIFEDCQPVRDEMVPTNKKPGSGRATEDPKIPHQNEVTG